MHPSQFGYDTKPNHNHLRTNRGGRKRDMSLQMVTATVCIGMKNIPVNQAGNKYLGYIAAASEYVLHKIITFYL